MSSFFSRLWRAPNASKRLASQLTQKSENKFSALLQRMGWKKLMGVDSATVGPRTIATTPVRHAEMVDDIDLATGIAKREMLLRESGCTDPWAMNKPMRRGSGRENDPTPIPSAFDGRMVGCVCLGDRFAKWMWLEKGDPKRCECGHYFVLKNVPPV